MRAIETTIIDVRYIQTRRDFKLKVRCLSCAAFSSVMLSVKRHTTANRIDSIRCRCIPVSAYLMLDLSKF